MKLILNGEALRPPITGVGNYSYHLLGQYLEGGQFDEVHCFTGTNWLSGDAQLAFTGAHRARTDLENTSARDAQTAPIPKPHDKIPDEDFSG